MSNKRLKNLVSIAWTVVFTVAVVAAPALVVSACYKWTPVPTPDSSVTLVQLFDAEPPDRVRVHRIDGTVTELSEPRLRNDSIVGSELPTLGVPLSEVQLLEVREVDDSKLVRGTFGIVAAGLMVGYFVALGSDGFHPF